MPALERENSFIYMNQGSTYLSEALLWKYLSLDYPFVTLCWVKNENLQPNILSQPIGHCMRGCCMPKHAMFYCYFMHFWIKSHNIMACEIEYWWENKRVRNNDTESRKNLACFQTYRFELHCLQGCFRKHTGREDI